jgi:hypothetical protein
MTSTSTHFAFAGLVHVPLDVNSWMSATLAASVMPYPDKVVGLDVTSEKGGAIIALPLAGE